MSGQMDRWIYGWMVAGKRETQVTTLGSDWFIVQIHEAIRRNSEEPQGLSGDKEQV